MIRFRTQYYDGVFHARDCVRVEGTNVRRNIFPCKPISHIFINKIQIAVPGFFVLAGRGIEEGLAQADDLLRVAYISEEEPYTVCLLEENVSTRADGGVTVALPEEFKGQVQLYLFFQSADGKRFSESKHFTVNL